MEVKDIVPGTSCRHYKTGGWYTIIGIGHHTETDEKVVIYQSQEDDSLWVRPYDNFRESVSYKGKIVPRFSRRDI